MLNLLSAPNARLSAFSEAIDANRRAIAAASAAAAERKGKRITGQRQRACEAAIAAAAADRLRQDAVGIRAIGQNILAGRRQGHRAGVAAARAAAAKRDSDRPRAADRQRAREAAIAAAAANRLRDDARRVLACRDEVPGRGPGRRLDKVAPAIHVR